MSKCVFNKMLLQSVILHKIKCLRWFSATKNFKIISNEPIKMETKFLKNISPTDRRSFLNSFNQVLCDCDGVVWQTMHDVIPGSVEAIKFLQKWGKKVNYVTNNSMDDHIQKFKKFNLTVEKNDIIHPAQTICDYLQEIQFNGLIYCISTAPFKDILRKAGFQLVEDQNANYDTMLDLRNFVYNKDPVKAVVIDVVLNCAAAYLIRAHVHLKDPECLFIGGAADSMVSFGGGDVIGPGPFINIVEVSSKREATILGKPGKHLRDRLVAKYATPDAKRTLFIGDSLNSDIKFGKMCGFQTLLVLSGGTKAEDLESITNKDEMPDYVIDSLGDLVELLKE